MKNLISILSPKSLLEESQEATSMFTKAVDKLLSINERSKKERESRVDFIAALKENIDHITVQNNNSEAMEKANAEQISKIQNMLN